MRPLVLLLLCSVANGPVDATRASKARHAKEEAKRLGLAVREHGVAGRYSKSIEASLQAIALDPSTYSLYTDLSFTLMQVTKQPQHEQQRIKQRLAEARGGGDDKIPFVPRLTVAYSPSASLQARAIQVAKVGVEVGCAALARSAQAVFVGRGDHTWMGPALDALSQKTVSKPPSAHVQNCVAALSRVASSADDLDPLASFVAGRLALAFEKKYGHRPGYPELFNW